MAPGDGQAAHAGVRHAHGLDLGADGRDLNGRGIQKNGRMLRGGLQCRLLFRFLREGRNGQRGQHGHAQCGDDEIEVTPLQDGTVAFDIVAELHPAQDRCEHGCAAGDAEQCSCTGGPESLHGNGLPFKH